MATKRKFKSGAFEAIHAAVEGMVEAGTIDKETMRTFNEERLATPQPPTPKKIRSIRENSHLSQPAFATTSAPCPFGRRCNGAFRRS